jgi:hypothetical protein
MSSFVVGISPGCPLTLVAARAPVRLAVFTAARPQDFLSAEPGWLAHVCPNEYYVRKTE